MDDPFINLCYGGVVFDDTRVNLYDVFDNDDIKAHDLTKLIEECSSDIGDIQQYLDERNEGGFVPKEGELICYLQMPADIWDAIYGESDGDDAEFLKEKFEEFIENQGLSYELTEYGRNAAVVYACE